MWAGLFKHAKRGAELVAALIFAIMFGAFLLQVFMRYVMNDPLTWTLEVSLMAYVWVVFWSAAFIVDYREHVAFNMLYEGVAPGRRRYLAAFSAMVVFLGFVVAFPATFDYVQFLAFDRTWVLEFRFDLVYSIYLVFMAVVAFRAALLVKALFGRRWAEHI